MVNRSPGRLRRGSSGSHRSSATIVLTLRVTHAKPRSKHQDHQVKAEHTISLVPPKLIDIPTVALLPKTKTKAKTKTKIKTLSLCCSACAQRVALIAEELG